MEYQRAAKQIRDLIGKEKFAVGDKIPSINSLSKKLDIGRMSVQQAVELLCEEGVLESIPRSGCYVRNLSSTLDSARSSLASQACDRSPFTFLKETRKKIRVGILGDLPLFSHLWKRLFLDYMRDHGDVSIEIIPIDNPYMPSPSAGYDIFQVPLSFVSNNAESGTLYSLDEIGGVRFDVDDFYAGFRPVVRSGGGLWGVPLVSAVNCCFLNKRHVRLADKLDFNHGFWSFFDSVEAAAHDLPKGVASILALDVGIGSLMMFSNKDKACTFRETSCYIGTGVEEFTKSFERYFQNPKVTAPFLLPAHYVSETASHNFFGGGCPLSLSVSSSVPNYLAQAAFGLKLLPLPLEDNGKASLAANVNVISRSSRYPMECVEILNHMGSYEVQSAFAKGGRLVAHRRANAHLKIKGLDTESLGNLIAALERGAVPLGDSMPFIEFTHTVIFHEMEKWRQGQIDSRGFLDCVRKKARFFFKRETADGTVAVA